MTCTVSTERPIIASVSISFSSVFFYAQDRCVSKYLEAQQRVGVILQKANEAQLEQQQNMAQMQQRLG